MDERKPLGIEKKIGIVMLANENHVPVKAAHLVFLATCRLPRPQSLDAMARTVAVASGEVPQELIFQNAASRTQSASSAPLNVGFPHPLAAFPLCRGNDRIGSASDPHGGIPKGPGSAHADP